jgi:signal transduction histidine kinase
VPAALHPILDECLALARARCTTANVTMERAYDASCPEIRVDSRELRKAFLNLFLNGLEALAPGGRLTVRTTYAPGSGTVTVVVEDTGTGMSEETLARAFDLFFTTKPEGTGLGMAITRSVIDLHDGTLDIESAPGQGTRVRVRLPVGAPADAEAART